MECKDCGSYIPQNYDYCPSCRRKVEAVHGNTKTEDTIPPPLPDVIDVESDIKEVKDLDSTKTCPYCAEIIKLDAIICRFCRMNLRTGKAIESAGSPSDQFFNVLRFGCLTLLSIPVALILLLLFLSRGCGTF